MLEIKKSQLLVLDRLWKKEGYIIGNLSYCGRFVCNTLEDQWRDYAHGEQKVPGVSAIPAGRYEVQMTYSPKFKRMMPLLMNVPQFVGVRIHSGNTKEDTEGCILVGKNLVKGRLVDSKIWSIAVEDIIRRGLKKDKMYIDIFDRFKK